MTITSAQAIWAKTVFIWETDKRDPTKGVCYQVDEQTQGQTYKTREKIEKCRPKETAYLFVPTKGQCYEVDSETQGRKFIELSKIDFCRPLKTEKKFRSFLNKPGCYEVDTQTGGEYFYKIQDQADCQETNNMDIAFAWKYQSPGKGDCYKIVKQNPPNENIYIKVDSIECKPTKTKLVFYRTGDFSGLCTQEDINDPKNYSNKVTTSLCKEGVETAFIFFTPPRSKTGKCYEVDIATKGNQYLNNVDTVHCKP